MSRAFTTLYKDIFKEDYQKETYKMQDHSFVFSERLRKSVCSRCGLLALKNQFTQWSVDKGCFSDLHPQYENKRKQFTGMHL